MDQKVIDDKPGGGKGGRPREDDVSNSELRDLSGKVLQPYAATNAPSASNT